MANVNNDQTFLGELAVARLYKKNQGRVARQLTFFAVAIVIAFGAFTLYESGMVAGWFETPQRGAQVNGAVFALLVAVGGWFAFRLVNFPKFADFLISVEAEMDKVTWATRDQLYQATVVVITTMLFLGVLLFAYDLMWMRLFKFVGFLEI